MPVGLFSKIFPPPKYLAMRATGVDVSDRSIKYCDLSPDHSGFKVDRFGELVLPAGVIEAGQIQDKLALVAVLKKLRQELGIVHVAAALPEEQAFIVKLTLPAMARSQIRQSLELQLEEHVPLRADQLFFDYEIVRAPGVDRADYEVVVSAFPRAVVLDYLEVMINAGLVPLSYEIEAQAVARAIVARANRPTKLVVDFGKTRTGLVVVSDGRVLATSTIASIGGELITNAIQKSLNLSYGAAERLKINHGILQSRKDNRLLFALVPILSVLRDEVDKFQSYWDTHAGCDRQTRISGLILCGGQATLPGLPEYLGGGLNLPVEVGDVWVNVYGRLSDVPPINRNDSLKYATALGLALKNYD